MHKLKVAIVGGGIGGLTRALALRRFGHDPVVIEQTRELRPIGAGISLWPNGIKVLNLLGLGQAIADCGGRMDRMAYANREGNLLLDFGLSALYERVGERARPVERAALQQLLLDEVGPDVLSLGVRASSVEAREGGAVLHTEDGRTIEADLVIAADGTHSGLRDYVVGHHVERRYVGYVNWNGLVEESAALAPQGTWLTWVGEGKRASLMPVGHGQCYFFFDVPMPFEESVALRGPTEELGAAFSGWAAPVRSLIERFDEGGVAQIAIHDTPELERWRRGAVVLLGDAAHTMAPDLGQGGCQAMEDAWVLAHHLTANNHGVADALDRYQAERIPHTASIVRRARERAELIHGHDAAATTNWYRSLASDGHAGIVEGLARSVETGPCR